MSRIAAFYLQDRKSADINQHFIDLSDVRAKSPRQRIDFTKLDKKSNRNYFPGRQKAVNQLKNRAIFFDYSTLSAKLQVNQPEFTA